MENKNTIQDELIELKSQLPSHPNGSLYPVPEGYFEGLASEVLSKIKGEQYLSASAEIAELSPLLSGLSKNNPYSVPDHYFQSNIAPLPAFISDEESLVLSFITKEMPYETPAGYFAGLPEQILEKVIPRRAKVVPMMSRKWRRLAVAAMITGLVAVSGITYFKKENHTTAKDPVTIVKKASTQELNDFLKSINISPNENKSQLTAKNVLKSDSKKLFQNVSDSELKNFLDQMPSDDDLNFN